ncbi:MULTISPECIES: hypothetical protein [unclassified Mesorhizobium]|nr:MULTISPECIES: hypothetical protein [unclassified Mesorhizobium]
MTNAAPNQLRQTGFTYLKVIGWFVLSLHHPSMALASSGCDNRPG